MLVYAVNDNFRQRELGVMSWTLNSGLIWPIDYLSESMT